MKKSSADRADGHAIPGTPSVGVPADGINSEEGARVVRLDSVRAERDRANLPGASGGEVLPVALAAEALRFPKERGVAGFLASDGPLVGRLAQFALMGLGLAVAVWVAAQLTKPDLGAVKQPIPAEAAQ
ncbi:hypothetical protein [Novosphingobium sp.]|uniref:hypothetical protein n=1 Tax=Novosphingobium sp. TaxID=1874826 RepID=UPI002FE2E62E